VPQITHDGPRRVSAISGYTLALSWSPEFCRTRAAAPAHAVQCSGQNGSFGLIVHGLWPDSVKGWPQWCEAKRALTPAEVRGSLCLMPSARLVARQWAKHGSCMVKRPASYLKVIAILRSGLRFPEYDRIAREKGLTAGRIRAAYNSVRVWNAETAGEAELAQARQNRQIAKLESAKLLAQAEVERAKGVAEAEPWTAHRARLPWNAAAGRELHRL
jgi:ribonuclease T2